MVDPTKVKPRRLRSLPSRSERSVLAGTAAMVRGRLTFGDPSTHAQR